MLLFRVTTRRLLSFPKKTLINPNPRRLLTSSSSSSDAPPPSIEKEKEKWTEEIIYLDESDNLISSFPGARPASPSSDSHLISSGSVRHPIPPSSAAERLSHLALRWGWGPNLDSALDSLPFPVNPNILTLALSHLHNSSSVDPIPPSLSLLRWSRRQTWFPSSAASLDGSLSILLDRLHSLRQFDEIHSVFQEFILPQTQTREHFSFPYVAANRALQYLSQSGHLELAFSSFKKLKELGLDRLETKTYNSLIDLFLGKGLPYKAFEIYESMESKSCSLDASTYEIIIPSLALSERLDAALKLFQHLNGRENRSAVFPIYFSISTTRTPLLPPWKSRSSPPPKAVTRSSSALHPQPLAAALSLLHPAIAPPRPTTEPLYWHWWQLDCPPS